MAYGLFFSFSVFLVPLVAEFQWSRALTAGALSVSTVVQGVCAPLAGLLVDRVGPRPVILGGVVLVGGAAMLSATIQAPWQLYLYTGVLGALGIVALGWVPMGVLLARRFAARRGRVVGIAFSGMGVGVFAIGPLAQWLIVAIGWRGATAVLGVTTLVLLLPLVWFGAGRDVPAAPATAADGPPRGGVHPTVGRVVRTRAFWALFLAYFFTPLAVFPVATHSVAFAVDVGFSAMRAAWAFGLTGLMSTVGRVGFGIMADRVGGPWAATLSFACTATGALALMALERWPHGAWLLLFALLFGLGFGARGPIITAMASEWFGGRHFGAIYGVLNLGNGLGAALGPWFGGVVHDVTGSYRLAFATAIACCAVGAACFWLARRPRLDDREGGVLTPSA
jgi:MFS family permease